jgi:kynurenine formamidase
MTSDPASHHLPSYDDLPLAPDGGRSGWGIFGADDNVGLLNLQGAEQVRAGAGLVRRGAVFPLNAPLDAFNPALAMARGTPRPKVIHRAGTFRFDDVIDNFYPQASSQWDSLAHVGYGLDTFYNGATEDDILAGRRNTIEHWAKKGIVGRGVVLDLVRTLAEDGRPYSPGDSVAFSVDDLELARQRAGIDFRPGDVLLLHTGFATWYGEQSEADRVAMPRQLTAAGIEHSEAMARYLWDSHASALATDNFAVEVWPADLSADAEPFGFMHQVLIGLFGLALGELWWLHDLAADCAADGVYETMLVSAPLHSIGGVGSPPNAIAIK